MSTTSAPATNTKPQSHENRITEPLETGQELLQTVLYGLQCACDDDFEELEPEVLWGFKRSLEIALVHLKMAAEIAHEIGSELDRKGGVR